jgi:hypothetical protein
VERINEDLIAPCGMNCGVCLAYLREKNKCHGCREAEKNKPKTRVSCRIRICSKRKGKYCFECTEFPCQRLRRLDKRYRTRYGMSEIENLEFIRLKGINSFVESERKRWQSSKGLLCVHNREYY